MSEAIRPADRSDAADGPCAASSPQPAEGLHPRHGCRGRQDRGAVAIERSGVDLFSEQALGQPPRQRLQRLQRHRALERRRVRGGDGLRADVLISWGDVFRDRTPRRSATGSTTTSSPTARTTAAGRASSSSTTSTPTPSSSTATSQPARPRYPRRSRRSRTRSATRSSISAAAGTGAGRWSRPPPITGASTATVPDLEFTGPLAGAARIGSERARLDRQLLGRHHPVGHGALV